MRAWIHPGSSRWLFASLLILCLGLPAAVLGQDNAAADHEASGNGSGFVSFADTSSPRDTLRTFLDSTDAVYRAGIEGRLDEILQPRSRGRQTLDFSETVDGFRWDEQSMRMLYLKEILDRLPLPPWESIPGDDQVESAEIDRWRIPGSQIVIHRVEGGDRDGEFLFSAETVARLHAIYRRVRHLPYQPGASENFLDSFTAGDLLGSLATRIRDRLRPVDTSSPRVLFDGFLANVNAAYQVVMEADAAMRQRPPALSREQAGELNHQAISLMERAVATLDLEEVADALQRNVGLETVLKLKEIIDRAPLPALQSIPGPRQVHAIRDQGDRVRWNFPDTDIEILEIVEGPHAGLFRFSAETVERIAGDYERVADLPYRGERDNTGAETRFMEQYESAEVSAGFYDYYISTPGTMVPAASRISTLVEWLPAFMSTIYLDQTLWQWLGILVSLAVFILGLIAVQQLGRWLTRHGSALTGSLLKISLPLINVFIVILVRDFVDLSLNTTGMVLAAVSILSSILITVFLASAVFRIGVAISEAIVSLPQMEDREFDANLIRVAARVLGFAVAVVVAVNGFNALGVDVMPLIAGLGVGGLAVALAVRPTLENMIGGLIIYADKPVMVGDFCVFGDQKGIVESIGLRSTRIRALDRSVITVPNSVFADMQIVNLARCDTLLISTVIGVRYETSMEQLRNIMAKMRQICFAHPKIETDTLRIRFTGFGSSSLDITVRVYALTNEWNEFHAIREDLFFRFADAIEAAGSGIAFPSTTVYMSQDDGLDEERKRKAEEEVAGWRESDELPFPLTPEPLARDITDTLDYPPEGSPGAVGKRTVQKKGEQVSGED